MERLPTLAKLADTQPDVPVIVNHLGGRVDPDASESEQATWRANIDAIAKSPNAVIKVGGAQQRVGPWEPPFHMHQREVPISSEELCELLWPWYAYVIEAFGPERCMFESNFPVDKRHCSYAVLVNAFKKLSSGYSNVEKSDLFAGTAQRAYRI